MPSAPIPRPPPRGRRARPGAGPGGPRRPGRRPARGVAALGAGLALGRHRRRLPLPRPAARPPAGREPHLPHRHQFAGMVSRAPAALAARGTQAGPLLGGLAGAAAVGQQGPVRPVRGRRVRRLLPPDRRQPAGRRRARAPSSCRAGRRTSARTSTPGASTTPAQIPRLPRLLAPRRRGAQAGRARHPGRVQLAKMTRNPEFRSLDLYPGDDAVDGWSLQYYDNGPPRARRRSGTSTTT